MGDTKNRGDGLPYIICSLHRSGGGLLCSYLESTKRVGAPHEYLIEQWSDKVGITYSHPINMSDAALLSLFDKIRAHATGDNGRWGIRVHPPEFGLLRQYLRLQGVPLDKYKWIYLSRDNVVRQAISVAKAHKTKQYTRGKSGSVIEPNPISTDVIKGEILSIHLKRMAWTRYFEKEQITPFRVRYEQFASVKPAELTVFIESVLDYLEVPYESPVTVKTWSHRMSTDYSEKLYQTFMDTVVDIENFVNF